MVPKHTTEYHRGFADALLLSRHFTPDKMKAPRKIQFRNGVIVTVSGKGLLVVSTIETLPSSRPPGVQ